MTKYLLKVISAFTDHDTQTMINDYFAQRSLDRLARSIELVVVEVDRCNGRYF